MSGQSSYGGKPKGSSSSADPYYGHEETATLCARFITHLFMCPNPPQPSPPLANFIAYAIYRTHLDSSVAFAALYLLQRLKSRLPNSRGSSGYRLFLPAFIIASKVLCDDTYSNKSWSIVSRGMFLLKDINHMEREMCSYLEWQLNIEASALKEFEEKVRRDFKGLGPYPNYVLPPPAPYSMPSAAPYNAKNGAGGAAPSFTARSQQPPSISPPKPISPPVIVRAGPPPHSASTSPHKRAPRTPDDDHSIQVVENWMTGPVNFVDSQVHAHSHGAKTTRDPTSHGYEVFPRGLFALATPCTW